MFVSIQVRLLHRRRLEGSVQIFPGVKTAGQEQTQHNDSQEPDQHRSGPVPLVFMLCAPFHDGLLSRFLMSYCSEYMRSFC